MQSSDNPAATLRRTLGLADAVAIGMGAVVGAGIFVVIGMAAGMAGPALLPALTIAGVAATCNALSSAQLAAEYPQAGGTYEYGYRVLGPWAGFAAGWMFLVSKATAAGTVALGLAAYLAVLAPGLPARGVAVGGVVVFTALNAWGVRRSATVNLIITTIAVGTLLVFAMFAAGRFDAANLRPFAPAGLGGTMRAAALLFFAYTGYARIATLGEEVRDPRSTIPRAIGITVAGALCLYAVVALAAVGATGAATLAASPAPLAAAARELGRPGLERMVAGGAVAAMLGVLLSQILGLSRMVFAMARRGDLPAGLARVHPGSGTPVNAVLLVGAAAAASAAWGSVAAIASAASFAILVYYGIANVAALRMPRSARRFPNAVAWTGLVGCATLALSLAPATMAAGAVALAAGFGVRAMLRGVAGRGAAP
ncbi:MAG TPA: amino acid permease [Longimicrobium sp.]|nr:amino acid permease [Longimicrobium sp.]